MYTPGQLHRLLATLLGELWGNCMGPKLGHKLRHAATHAICKSSMQLVMTIILNYSEKEKRDMTRRVGWLITVIQNKRLVNTDVVLTNN